MREALKPEELAQYAIEGDDEQFAHAVGGNAPAPGTLVSVKVGPGRKGEAETLLYKRKKDKGVKRAGKVEKSGSSKKRRH
jgi:hypothetical protein